MRKRLALITANTDTLYQTSMIRIISEQSALLGYDLIVLTHFVNYDDGGDYMKGDENIYSLIFQLSFDGAVVDLGSFYSRSLSEKLEKMLKEKNIPVIALDYPSKYFESCLQHDRAGFEKLTEHFITEHNFTRICCLSGPEGEVHSEERIMGYRDAFRKHGLPIEQKYIFYGDFWIGKAVEFAEKIISGEIEKPQAVVCGSDYMALQLCLTLIKNGVRIPEEIAVGGYDGNPGEHAGRSRGRTRGRRVRESGRVREPGGDREPGTVWEPGGAWKSGTVRRPGRDREPGSVR